MQNVCDSNYLRHVGYSENNQCIQLLFSQKNVDFISKEVTCRLQGLDKSGRPIVVTDDVICNVIDQMYQAYRPPTGDIYSRYNVPTCQEGDYVSSITMQTINVIVNHIKLEYGVIECNEKLDIWKATKLGDFNENGLRAHSKIKIQEKQLNRRGKINFMSY